MERKANNYKTNLLFLIMLFFIAGCNLDEQRKRRDEKDEKTAKRMLELSDVERAEYISQIRKDKGSFYETNKVIDRYLYLRDSINSVSKTKPNNYEYSK